MYAEILNNAAEIPIHRKMALSDVKEAYSDIHDKTSPEGAPFIEAQKEVCVPGFQYKDAMGKDTAYKEQKAEESSYENLIDAITRQV